MGICRVEQFHNNQYKGNHRSVVSDQHQGGLGQATRTISTSIKELDSTYILNEEYIGEQTFSPKRLSTLLALRAYSAFFVETGQKLRMYLKVMAKCLWCVLLELRASFINNCYLSSV